MVTCMNSMLFAGVDTTFLIRHRLTFDMLQILVEGITQDIRLRQS
jgi:hypothetical protein